MKSDKERLLKTGKDDSKMNLPNKLTLARIVMIPFFVVFMLWNGLPHRFLIALVIFAVASFTDMKMRNVRSSDANPKHPNIIASNHRLTRLRLKSLYDMKIVITNSMEKINKGER